MADTISLKTQVYKLPSRGLPYKDDPDLKLIDGNSVKIGPLLTGHFANAPIGVSQSEQYRNLLMQVIKEPKMEHPGKLLGSDILAILVMVRILTYNSDYYRTWWCTRCQHQHDKYKFNLDKLDVRTPDDFKDWSADGLEFVTDDGHTLVCHLPRGNDQDAMEELMNRWQGNKILKNSPIDSLLTRLVSLIDTIDGRPMPGMEKLSFLKQLTFPEVEDLDAFINENNIGIDPVLPVACKNCSFDNKVAVSFDTEFFRPKRERKTKHASDPVPADQGS